MKVDPKRLAEFMEQYRKHPYMVINAENTKDEKVYTFETLSQARQYVALHNTLVAKGPFVIKKANPNKHKLPYKEGYDMVETWVANKQSRSWKVKK